MKNKNLRNIFIVLVMAFGVLLLKVDTVYAVSCSKAATKVYSFQGVVCTSNGSGGYEHAAPETIENQASCPSQFSGTCTSAGTYRIGNCDESYECSDGTLITIDGAQRCYKTFSDSCPSGWNPEDSQTVAKPTTSNCTQVTYNGSQKAIVSGASGYTWDSPYCTDVCTKNITATLNSGWTWSDGTTAPVTIRCSLTSKGISPVVSCSNKTYNGNTTASCTVSFSGVVSGDTVTPASGMTCNFADANIGTNKTVTCSNISFVDTGDAVNYHLTSSTATTTANIVSGGSGSTSYTITANANGGTITTTTGWTNSSDNTTATKSVNSGSTYGTLPTVTYTGKTLKEWNTKSDGTGTAVTSATTATATATIYAIWNNSDDGSGGQGGGDDQTGETKTITFNANGGTFTIENESKESIEVSGAVTSTLQQLLTVMPTKAGYKLDGWYTETEGGYAVALENPLSDISVTTLYAHWSVADSELDPSLPISTLTYNSNGGTACAPSTKQVNTGNPWGELCTPTFKGYKFNGWFTAKTGGSKVTNETVANGDLTVYAQWRKATTVNPKTGIFTPIAAILLLGIVSSVTFLIVKRRSAGI